MPNWFCCFNEICVRELNIQRSNHLIVLCLFYRNVNLYSASRYTKVTSEVILNGPVAPYVHSILKCIEVIWNITNTQMRVILCIYTETVINICKLHIKYIPLFSLFFIAWSAMVSNQLWIEPSSANAKMQELSSILHSLSISYELLCYHHIQRRLMHHVKVASSGSFILQKYKQILGHISTMHFSI